MISINIRYLTLITLISLLSTQVCNYELRHYQQAANFPSGKDSIQQKSIERLLKYLDQNFEVKRKFQDRKDLSDGEFFKILIFLANDPYYREMLIDSLISKLPNRWISRLSIQGQKYYLQTLPRFYFQSKNSSDFTSLIKNFQQNEELSKVFLTYKGGPPNGQELAQSFQSLKSFVNKDNLIIST